jgi:protein-tyrosine kinase
MQTSESTKFVQPTGPVQATVQTATEVPTDRRIGTLLVAEGKLNPRDIDRILELQKKRQARFGETAVRLGLISVDDLRRALALQYELPHLLPDNPRMNPELIVAHDPFHRRAEQIRALRTQLLMRWGNGDVQGHALAVVSPGVAEGRSFLAANLAVAFAQLGRRTLLIDADLRRSRQQEIFGVPDRIGLSTVLSGRADHSAVVPVRDFGPLSVLPAGARPPNPVELLSRDVFPSLLRRLQTYFDVILLDTPAAQTCADAQAIAFRVGRVLLLARKDHTRLADTRRLMRQLGDAGAQTVGTVFNAY